MFSKYLFRLILSYLNCTTLVVNDRIFAYSKHKKNMSFSFIRVILFTSWHSFQNYFPCLWIQLKQLCLRKSHDWLNFLSFIHIHFAMNLSRYNNKKVGKLKYHRHRPVVSIRTNISALSLIKNALFHTWKAHFAQWGLYMKWMICP